jgi:outer membrane lipoprotein-sorting protein
MRRSLCLLAIVVLGASSLVTAQTVDEILAKHYEARGGIDKIRSIESARRQGTINIGGQQAPFSWEWKSPSKIRIEFSVQEMTGVTAFDGEVGWSLMPFLGQTEPVEMPPEELDSVKAETDFHGPLVDYASKGHQVELLGQEEIATGSAYKLEVTQASGEVTIVFIDAESFLEVRTDARRKMQGMDLDIQVTLHDYREVDGLMLPHKFEQTVSGAPVGQSMVFEKTELNIDLPDDRFAMPLKTEAPETADPEAETAAGQ